VFAIDGTPAQAVQHSLVELMPRYPDLIVAGINYGENVGTGVTISGTIGAVLEGASMGIPGLAVSLQTDPQYHHSYSTEIDFVTAEFFTRKFAQILLKVQRTPDVDVLKVEIPETATPETPWRMTRLEYITCRMLVADTGREAPQDAMRFYRASGWSDEALEHYRTRFGGFGKMVYEPPDSYRNLPVRVIKAVENSHHITQKLVKLYNWVLQNKQHWMKYLYWAMNKIRPETREFVHKRCIGYVRAQFDKWCPHIVVSVTRMTASPGPTVGRGTSSTRMSLTP